MNSARQSHPDDISEEDIQHDTDVELVYFPYLNGKINPEHLDFDENKPAYSPRKKSSTDFYSLQSGSFGSVCLAQNPETYKWIAVKKLHSTTSKKNAKEESETLKKVSQLIFHQENKIGMKLLKGSDLYGELNEKLLLLSFAERFKIAKKLINETGILHDNDFIHGDIKPENIILQENYRTNYCDYGHSFFLNNENETGLQYKKYRGTSFYYPPNIAKRCNCPIEKRTNPCQCSNISYEYDKKSDIFSLGVILAKLLGYQIQTKTIKFGKKNEEWFHSIEDNPSMPKSITQLIRDMTNKNPDERPTIDKIKARFPKQEYKDIKDFFYDKPDIAPRIFVISIDDFLKDATENENKNNQALYQKMSEEKINRVVLRGSSQTTNKDYYQARHLLTEANITHIAPFMVRKNNDVADENKVNQVVKHYYDKKLSTPHTQIYHYKYPHKYPPITKKLSYFYRSSEMSDFLIGCAYGAAAVGLLAFSFWTFGLPLIFAPLALFAIPIAGAIFTGLGKLIKPNIPSSPQIEKVKIEDTDDFKYQKNRELIKNNKAHKKTLPVNKPSHEEEKKITKPAKKTKETKVVHARLFTPSNPQKTVEKNSGVKRESKPY